MIKPLIKPFKYQGKVIQGEKIGRTIGFPTANLQHALDMSHLKPGVYLGKCSIFLEDKCKNKDLNCLAYFGPRHIFGEKTNSFEVYIYNFIGNIYNYQLQVNLTHFLRKPIIVSNLSQLSKLVKKDQEDGLTLLKHDSKN